MTFPDLMTIILAAEEMSDSGEQGMIACAAGLMSTR
jgi:hypothetical protein